MNASDVVEDSNGEDEVTYADYRLRTEDDGERLRRNISTSSILQNLENIQTIPMRDLSQNK